MLIGASSPSSPLQEVLFDVKEAEVLVQEKASSKVSDIQGPGDSQGCWESGGAQLEGSWGQYKPGVGPTGSDHSPKPWPLPVPCAAPVPPSLPLHLLRGTLHAEPQDLRLLCGVSAACGPWEGDRGMWVWENKQARSRAAAGSLVRLKAGLGSEFCRIMDVFPFLALPPRALTGARLTAWCLHPVLSKNARKSLGESVREGFVASATISHTVEYQEFCSGPAHAGSDLIPFVEVTKRERYLGIFMLWGFFFP